MNLPVSICTVLAHDDALYWGNASQILSGNWLGVYSQMTLAKGPGFPLFLAASAVLGVPITLSIAFLYLFACGLIATTLRDVGVNKYLVLIIFVTTLFHPALFPARIIRDDIYPALLLITIAGAIRVVFAPLLRDHNLLRLVPYGLVLGLFWITREEGVWIIPGLLVFLALRMLQLWSRNLPSRKLVVRCAFFLFVATAFVSLIASINYYHYGKFEVVDFKGAAYSQALKSLNSVDVGQDLPFLPVSFAKRQEIYKVSPTFAQLKHYFEGAGKGWTSHGCKIYPWTCGDYAGGWFAWALRDAVASRGYYANTVQAADFYKRITKEIETACDAGTIKCRTNPVPFMPNITIDQVKEFPGKAVEAIRLAMVQLPIPIAPTGCPSQGSLEQVEKVRRFLRYPLTAPEEQRQRINVAGWFYSTAHEWLITTCSASGSNVIKNIERNKSPDIAIHFNDKKADFQRFSISERSDENCSISLDSSPEIKLAINSLLGKQKTGFSMGEKGTLYLDQVSETKNQSLLSAQVLSWKIKGFLVKLYKESIPVLVLLGGLTYLVRLMFVIARKRPITDIFIVSTMMWCLFFSRIALLVLVDISSFPAINNLYMLAAFPVLCLASLLSVYLFYGKKVTDRNYL